MKKFYSIQLDQGDSYIVVVPGVGDIGRTGYTAEGPFDHDDRELAARRVYDRWLDGLRASDRTLYEALREVPELEQFCARVAAGEWNDYFGKHAMPQHHLIAELRIQQNVIVRAAFAGQDRPGRVWQDRVKVIAAIVDRVLMGDFDGTKAESAEWAESPEGADAFADLIKGK